jgi:hypothetical protein
MQPRGVRSNDHRPHGKDQLARVNVEKLNWPWLCGEAQLSLAKVEMRCLPGPRGEAHLALVTRKSSAGLSWSVLVLATRRSSTGHMEKLG